MKFFAFGQLLETYIPWRRCGVHLQIFVDHLAMKFILSMRERLKFRLMQSGFLNGSFLCGDHRARVLITGHRTETEENHQQRAVPFSFPALNASQKPHSSRKVDIFPLPFLRGLFARS